MRVNHLRSFLIFHLVPLAGCRFESTFFVLLHSLSLSHSICSIHIFVMFAKLASALFAVSTLLSGTFASPVPGTWSPAPEVITTPSHVPVPSRHISFNGWGGLHGFNNFDRFYGIDNFNGGHFTPVVRQEQQLVCRTQAVEVIQQRLVVLQEMAKRIILEQICEVEIQTVVFQQFHASLGNFRNDIHRTSGRPIGFDSGISSHFGQIIGSDGSLTSDNFGFSGTDLGANTVVVGGSNWNDFTSPSSVSAAFGASQFASSSF